MVENLHIIRHFHISHNAPYLPPTPHPHTPAEILHIINLCFSFLLGITDLPREIEKNAYAKLCHC